MIASASFSGVRHDGAFHGLRGVLRHIGDQLAFVSRCSDIDDERVASDGVPVFRQLFLAPKASFGEDVKVRMPEAVGGRFQFKEGRSANNMILPAGSIS